ncbi:TMEM165/GDT1 family protein [Actinomycetospora chiangmaiensis]|uniref:TMEM165/GDT1 family protein n=1 Tax=Actinomycetospora chiangmaiensis TaxID=402650 RepID=UPI00037BC148|nr:TMEM165/GDT1 family protein [Actinomycetospora chiangmaiensis]
MSLAVTGIVFAIIFPAELPDKTALASLMLGSRYDPRQVFAGVAGAFLVHVCLAIAAGSLIALLPQRIVEGVVAAMFVVGALLLLRGARGGESGEEEELPVSSTLPGWRVAATSFGVILVAEFGDLTQIVTANLAAHYQDPIAVGVGATLALWAVGGLAILGGRKVQKILSLTWLTRIAALVMIVLAGFSLASAVTG